MKIGSAENSLIGSRSSSISWPKIGGNAFRPTVAKKKGPGDTPGPVKGAVLQ
jgi:hypothetical protein